MKADGAHGPSWKKQGFLVQTISQRKYLDFLTSVILILLLVAMMMENSFHFIETILMIMHGG